MTMSPSDSDAIRAKVVAIATSFLGDRDPTPFWFQALGRAPTKAELKLAWCGVFNLAVYILAGVTKRRWVFGKGFIYPARLPRTSTPRPGDVLYLDAPYQHHAIFTGADDTWLYAIGGNTPNVAEQKFKKSGLGKTVVAFSIQPMIDNEASPPRPNDPGDAGPPAPPTPPTSPKINTSDVISTNAQPVIPLSTLYDDLVGQFAALGARVPTHAAATVMAIAGVEAGRDLTPGFASARRAIYKLADLPPDHNDPALATRADANEYAARTSNNIHGTQFFGSKDAATEFIDFFYAIDKRTDGSEYVARFRRFPSKTASYHTTYKWLTSHAASSLTLNAAAPYPVLASNMHVDGYYQADPAKYTTALRNAAAYQLPFLQMSATAITSTYPTKFDPLGIVLPTVFWFYPVPPARGNAVTIQSNAHSIKDAASRSGIPHGTDVYVAALYPGAPSWTATARRALNY